MGLQVIESLIVKELWVGTYTATPATDSIGFITIKDSSGTDRKVMIQA